MSADGYKTFSVACYKIDARFMRNHTPTIAHDHWLSPDADTFDARHAMPTSPPAQQTSEECAAESALFIMQMFAWLYQAQIIHDAERCATPRDERGGLLTPAADERERA